MKQKILCLLLALVMLFLSCGSALAWKETTLYNGCRGEAVRSMQQALISLGYLAGSADGIFGNMTENAVRAFQQACGLTSDGLAGVKTLDILYSMAGSQTSAPTAAPVPQKTDPPKPTATPAPQPTAAPVPVSEGLFGGDYSTLRVGSTGARVKALQTVLIRFGFLADRADGIFGNLTRTAVVAFQQASGLVADGLAGTKTLHAVESAAAGETAAPVPPPVTTPAPTAAPGTPVPTQAPGGDGTLNDPIALPSASSVRLLHWFNDIKPSLGNGQHLLVADPSSGLCWTLRIMSRGRHADCEPLTARDTATMVKAFGGVNTWDQKAVYVRLPNGTWTVGSTHDMPHLSGSIKDNDFDGHLCVHFLRDMAECEQNDPNYGVANQNTIRSFWLRLTGQTVQN